MREIAMKINISITIELPDGVETTLETIVPERIAEDYESDPNPPQGEPLPDEMTAKDIRQKIEAEDNKPDPDPPDDVEVIKKARGTRSGGEGISGRGRAFH